MSEIVVSMQRAENKENVVEYTYIVKDVDESNSHFQYAALLDTRLSQQCSCYGFYITYTYTFHNIWQLSINNLKM